MANRLHALFEACRVGDLETIFDFKHILRERIITNENGDTPLLIASANGQYIIAAYLCLISPGINIANNRGWTPLHAAAHSHQLAIARFLVERGADPNAKNTDRLTPLDLAALGGDAETVAMFLSQASLSKETVEITYRKLSYIVVPMHGCIMRQLHSWLLELNALPEDESESEYDESTSSSGEFTADLDEPEDEVAILAEELEEDFSKLDLNDAEECAHSLKYLPENPNEDTGQYFRPPEATPPTAIRTPPCR